MMILLFRLKELSGSGRGTRTPDPRIMISVRPDGDSWRVEVLQGTADDVDRREMIEQIASWLKAEFDLKG